MRIKSNFNKFRKQSQVNPGFAILNSRYIGAFFVVLIMLFGFIGLTNNPQHFIISMPQAQASASLGSGVMDFSRSQKIYMTRALHANHDNLIKLQGASVRALLENPHLVRVDLPTVVWQYRSEQCVLDIYFKSDKRNVDLSNIVHYEMRHRDYRIEEDFIGREASCMRSFLPPTTAPRLLSVSSIYKSVIE